MIYKSTLAGTVVMLALVLGTGCSRQAKVERALAAGDKSLAAGKFEVAEAEYQSALQLLPGDPKAAGRLGLLYFQQGRYAPSFLLLQEAVKGEPGNVEFQLVFGLLAQSAAKTADARRSAISVLESQPANEDALLLLADTCVTTRDNEEARRIIEELRSRAPAAAGHQVALGALSLARRDFAAAEAELQKALELNPRSGGAHAVLGSLHQARNDSGRAGEALKLAAELSPLRSVRRIRYIEHLLQTGATDAAKQELAALTTKAPDYLPAQTVSMNLAYRERRYEESSALAEKILDWDKTNHDALSQRAAVRIAQGDLTGGINALNQMEAIYPRSALVKFRLAHAYLRKGDRAAAEDSLNQALQISPGYDEAIVLLAELNLQKGNPAAVVPALTQLLERQPRIARAYVVLAQAFEAQGKYEQCLAVLRAYTERSPKSPEGPYFTALVLYHTGRKEEARRALEQSLRVAADYWPAIEMLVNDDLLAGRAGPAQERVGQLVEKFPGQAVAWLLRAKVRLNQNDLGGAESDAQKAIELNSGESHGYLLLAKVFLAAKKPQQAVEALAALAARSNQVGHYMQLGLLHSAQANHDAARIAYEKAVAIDARFVPALNNLAAVLSVNLGQSDKALGVATKARELAPSNPHVMDTLGWIHFLKGQFEAALPLVKASAEMLPAEPVVQFHLAMCLYQLGREAAARQAFERVLGASTDESILKPSRERLAILELDPKTVSAEVRRDLDERLQREPNDPVVLTRLAAIDVHAAAFDQAARRYEAALKVNPRDPRTLTALVELYAGAVPNAARARELARSAQALAPGDGPMLWKLGRIALGLGDFSWAATVLREAARLLPAEPELHFDKAHAVYSIGRVEEAEQALQDALGLASFAGRREEATRFAALLAAAQNPGRVPAARAEADAILARDPDYVPALMVSALAQEQAGDFKAANRSYERIVGRFPLFAPALRQQALLYAEHLGDDKKAEELASKVRNSYPDDAELAYAMGTICFRRAAYADAVRLLRQSARKRERHAPTYFFLGMAQFHLKNTAESRSSLERALQLQLPPQEANEARRVLGQLSKGIEGR